MAGKLRIHVKFGETKVLVPCGDGSISVSEMVEKAIGRYKKAKKLHEEDRVVPHRLYQDGGSVVDLDDEVCAVLDDKEMVILEYQFFPHDASADYVPVMIGAITSDINTTPTPVPSTQPPSLQPATQNHSNTSDIGNSTHYVTHNGLAELPPPSMSTPPLPPPSKPPLRPARSSPSVPSEMGSYSVNSGYQNGYNASDYSPPQDPYLEGNSYTVNRFRSSREDLLDPESDPVLQGQNDMDDVHVHVSEVVGFHHSETNDIHGPPLSQIGIDPTEPFSEEVPSINNPASQVSVHSYEGTSQPSLGSSQRFISHSPPTNYELDLLTPSSQVGDSGYSETQRSGQLGNHPSGSQHSLDVNSSKVPLDSPNTSTMNHFHFSSSQSMEQLNEFQMGGRGMTDSGGGGGGSPYHHPGGGGGGSPYHHPSFRGGSQFSHPTLSQEIPYSSMGHSQPENYPMAEPYGGGHVIASQYESHGWPHRNPRMYPNMPMHGYPQHRTQPQQGGRQYRPEFHTGGGNDRSSLTSSTSEYNFRTPYPPFIDKQERRRKQSAQEHHYEEAMRTGRGHQYPSYPEMYNYHRPYHHGPDDDPSLSQPITYMMYPHNPYGWYPPGFQSPMGNGPPPGMGVGMNRTGGSGRLTNTPSGYSLSQGGEPRMKHHGFGNEKGSAKPRKGVLKNSSDYLNKERRPRDDGNSRDRGCSIEEEHPSDEEDPDIDEMKPSPFRRSSRKSMYLDDASVWGRWQEKLDSMDFDDSYDYPSQQTSSPTSEEGKEKVDEESNDLGNIHIVELLRGEEALGIQLVSYTSKGRDLGVFIGEMDSDGFAAKSGELQLFDRILACNGEDFTQETNRRVEERFREMITKEPLLRMAVSRGLNLNLEQSTEEEEEEEEDNRPRDDPSDQLNSRATSDDTNRAVVSSSVSTLASTSVTNTRQLGVKKMIELTRGSKGTFGFGLASRDVATNADDIPVYVKSITTGGPAFQDGRMKIGDRILEVNGKSVKGMNQSEVLDLLRSSKDNLMVIVSRQQQVNEPQDEYSELSQPSGPEPLPTTIGKNVLVVNIPLDDCGLHGLGVTVYGRCSKKKGEDVGIYIKSLLPGGAAAKEGYLRVNDRLLSVNNQSLVNMSNSDALHALKKGLQHAKPGQDGNICLTIARTAGINRKQSLSMSSFSTQMPALQEEDSRGDSYTVNQETTEIGIDCPPETTEDYNFMSQISAGSQMSYGKSEEIPELSIGSFPNSQAPIPVSEVPRTYYGAPSDRMINCKAGSSPNLRRGQIPMPDGSSKKYRRENNSYEVSNERVSKQLGSTRPSNSLRPYQGPDASAMRHLSVSPTSPDRASWYMGGDSQSRASSDSPTYSRPSSIHSEFSDRSLNQYPHNMASVQPSRGPPFHYGHSRVGSGSFRRRASPPYDTLEQPPTKDSSSNNPSGKSPHTLPRLTSGRNSDRYSGRSSPTQDDATSLVSYSSDPDLSSSNPFKRDDKIRLSIPKKKSAAHAKLGHFKLDNPIPRLEGEGSPSPPLYRTGSDGDISITNFHYLPKEMFNNVEVGPNLRMAKSSSLESLQTVMHYTIRADVRGEDSRRFGISRSSTRNSFRRAVDRSYSGENIPSSTVISLTKSPQNVKRPRKGILSWIRTKKSKGSKREKNRRSRVRSSTEPEDIEDIIKYYGVSQKDILRMQSHSGKIEDEVNDGEDEVKDFEDDPDEMDSLRNSRAL